ncbi:DUF3871 family protein [Psychroflexus salis]|uniref:DUF3871 family protein n=1 Tax=Psychroflexus salis TaxID=1526574 RepID=A0A917E9K1_9FLAO|nr:DUF3871 family protein [Psychroflexus salis]GGE14036.1 hypothetical protein GCM10010831_14260 [Psychroflexus salis]
MELIKVEKETPNIALENHSNPTKNKSEFIGGRTRSVELNHLKNDCIIPVFSKDNETTISHYQFIKKAKDVIADLFNGFDVSEPNIRVSHQIKGRVPTAIGKPVKELQEHEKTIYYERCAFLMELTQIEESISGNPLTLSIGGVRAYNQENLYSRKNLEKFKIFIGFQNKVCLNLCVSTDGFSNEIRVGSVDDLENKMIELFQSYDKDQHLTTLESFSKLQLDEESFAHFIGKARMYQHLSKKDKARIHPMLLNDGQINHAVKQYYECPNFKRDANNNISLWNLYNLFTEANKTTYIDNNIERNVNAYEIIRHIANSEQFDEFSWYLPN